MLTNTISFGKFGTDSDFSKDPDAYIKDLFRNKIPGIIAELDKSNTLSDAEKEPLYTELFKTLDKDNNQKITKKEFDERLREIMKIDNIKKLIY